MSGHLVAAIAGVGLAVAIIAPGMLSTPWLVAFYALLFLVCSVGLGMMVGASLRERDEG